MSVSRREFIKLVTSSGIALSLSRASFGEPTAFEARETLPGRQQWHPNDTAVGRIDAAAKVTGAKLYASDFRAADLPGWPPNTSHALLIRSTDATHTYAGMDLSRLTGAMQPSRVVTAVDIEAAGIRVPSFYAGDLFCPVGTTALYLGQPVALLIFEQFDGFDRARVALREPSCLKYGKETGPVAVAPFGANRFVRVAGAKSADPDEYSAMQAGWVSPRGYASGDVPVWASANRHGKPDEQASHHGEQIRAGLAASTPEQLVLAREFRTQSADPMFLEPEGGIAWYASRSKSLELVVGVQSPLEAAQSVAYLLGNAHADFKPNRIHTHCAYVGGGFGGRDHTPMPLYIALAAMFLPDRPVRLANNRYEQFQSGIKRHAFTMNSRIGVDRASGKIRAFAADHGLDGGGLANYSATVAVVAATGAIGIYDIPKVDITTVAVHSRGVTAGSMRGYGTLQTMTALEVLIDEAASSLRIDPIEFRRRNVLPTSGRTMVGNPLHGVTRTDEILDKLEKHAIWQKRAAEKASARDGTLVGTGVACVTKDFGSGSDGTLASVDVSPDGRITIRSDAVEMGTAIGTALVNRVALVLGAAADEVALAQVDAFGPLELVTSGNPYTITQAEQDAAARNPRWVPEISSPSSASVGAHVSTHVAYEAARIVFRFGIWPAAVELWGIANDPRAARWQDARWNDGKLVLDGYRPLDFKSLAAKAHARRGVTAAMVHGFSRWAWSRASFRLAGQRWTADIDALAVRMGGDARSANRYVRVNRTAVTVPPTVNQRIGSAYSSVCGTLVRVEIERATGALRIARAYSVVECGRVLVPEVVVGQAQGGFAMGVGHALLESLPLYEDGPGNGQWNLGQYTIARASDLPLHDLEIEVLAPLTPDDPPKGMAEVVMIPAIPAIVNAICDATGHRFQSLPVTQRMLKGILA